MGLFLGPLFQHHIVLVAMSLQYNLRSGIVDHQHGSFCLGLISLDTPYCLFASILIFGLMLNLEKNILNILEGITSDLQIVFSNTDIFIMLILSVHDHCLYLLSAFIFFL